MHFEFIDLFLLKMECVPLKCNSYICRTYFCVFPLAQQPNAGQGRLILDVSGSHTMAHRSP